jgi:hypothetical protein
MVVIEKMTTQATELNHSTLWQAAAQHVITSELANIKELLLSATVSLSVSVSLFVIVYIAVRAANEK